jgi:hypothetical protein
MNIVGILGFAGSGKDTVGAMFREAGYEKASFAATLKDATSSIFGWKRELLEGDTDESRQFRDKADPFWTKHLGYEVTPRKMLQWLGTDACRNVIGDNIWVYSMLSNMDPNKKYVITDVRFPNEIRMIQEAGGTIIRVRRGPEPEWYNLALSHNHWMASNNSEFHVNPNSMSTKHAQVHYSEWAWIGTETDATFDNDSTIDDLRTSVDDFIKRLESKSWENAWKTLIP